MDITSYLTYLIASIIMLTIFTQIYLRLTPYDELALIRQGRGAACVSLAGTLIGYSLTLSASAIYNNSIGIFIGWAVFAMVVQLLGYVCVVKIIGGVDDKIEKNNVAVGSLIGVSGLVLGIINAGCLS
ncbi:MAG: DUF350 domain-containing protein [Gammaproteobacteria bacterium]|nr:MAG: DUF350 domain-containing protein [Gammaproteobacteria bacterium]